MQSGSRLLWPQIFLLLIGGGLMYAGNRLHTERAMSLGLAVVGLFVLISGIDAIVRQRLGFETSRADFGRRALYTGLAAQLWGIMFLVLAAMIFALAGYWWLHPGELETVWAGLFSTPRGWGIVMITLGLAAIGNGVIRMLAGSAGYYSGWTDRFARISGVVPVFIGLLLAVTGGLLLVAPDMFFALSARLWEFVQSQFFH